MTNNRIEIGKTYTYSNGTESFDVEVLALHDEHAFCRDLQPEPGYSDHLSLRVLNLHEKSTSVTVSVTQSEEDTLRKNVFPPFLAAKILAEIDFGHTV